MSQSGPYELIRISGFFASQRRPYAEINDIRQVKLTGGCS